MNLVPPLTTELSHQERVALAMTRHAQAKHRQQHGIPKIPAREVSPELGAAIDRCRMSRGLEPLY